MWETKTFCLDNFLTVSGAIVLFASQVIAVAAAAAWAFAGLLSLGKIGLYGLGTLFLSAALYACFAFAKQALKTEPFYK